MNQKEKGVILVTALLALLAMAIFLPALYFMIANEVKWSVKHKKSTVAFDMAEQGLARGVWKLQESDTLWDNISTGTVLTGYHFDVIYNSTDSAGKVEGQYKIKLTTSTTSGRVLIQALGRDVSTDELRGLEAEYYQTNSITAGLHVRSGLTYKSGTRVHWGPIICYGDIDLPNSPDNTSAFPRKIVKGYIDERTPTSASGPHGDSSETWDGTYDHWCHSSSLDTAPTVDLDTYRQLAQNSRIPNIASDTGGTAVSSPTGSGYFPSDGIALKIPGGGNSSASDAYVFNNSTTVIFVEKDYSFNTKNRYSQLVVRALIMPNAELSVNGDSKIPDRVVKIPTDAQKEYLYNGTHGNSTLGWSSAQGTNTQAFSAVGAGNNFTIANCLIHGFMYFDNVSNSGTDLVVAGVLDLQQATNPQSVIVYYDVDVSTGIYLSNQSISRSSWREIKATW
jgi:hypothetical protein